jgi:hypothetical protein
LSTIKKAGRVRIVVQGEAHVATWRVDGSNVVVSSQVGDATAALGGLSSAPAAVARETFRQLAREARKGASRR